MKATQALRDAGQSLWLDNIPHDFLNGDTLAHQIRGLSVTGLTCNLAILGHAFRRSAAIDTLAFVAARGNGRSLEELFVEVAVADITAVADLFRPIYERTSGLDGWVSFESSPLLADDPVAAIAKIKLLHARIDRPNVFIMISGTEARLRVIEEAAFAGVPLNVTLLFSQEQYFAVTKAWLRGIERRIGAGLNPNVASVASLFVNQWDLAVAKRVPRSLANRLGLAIAASAYLVYLHLISTTRWQRAFNAGAQPQRLLFAGSVMKNPRVSDTIYAEALVAPLTINAMLDETIRALADHGRLGPLLSATGDQSSATLSEFARAGVDLATFGAKLQTEAVNRVAACWNDLLITIASKAASLNEAG